MSFTTASGRVVYDQKEYKALFHKSIDYTELVLVDIKTNTIVSAYKTNLYGNFSAFNKAANEVCKIITQGVSLCTAKNGIPSSTSLGMTTEHSILKNDNTYQIQLYGNKQVYSALIHTKRSSINLVYDCSSVIPDNIPYIKLTDSRARGNIDLESGSNEEYIPVRSVEEIALEKDTEWLKNKKYYVVNDDETAEKLFQFLDNYKGPISFDTETTGLRINCFGKIGSQYQKDLVKYNNEHPDNPIRADKLVGIIFTVEENVSYYFPCGNRKFKNLYEDKNSPIRKRIIQNAKSRYVIGDLRDSFGDMRSYLAETPEEDITCDVILMERVRDIISKGHIVAHHGSFEWKVCWQYEIDCNLKDDTMLMHQILYKFRSTTSNSGEPSNLKYLAKVEFGIDQWELGDFFPTYSEDTGSVRGNKKKKKKSGKIDFSYMDLKGTRIYAPADGDVTLMLYHKYIKDLYENHSDQEYIYRVEVLVACAIGYMEFYGLRIDESKIMNAQESTRVNIYKQESLIRQAVNYASEKELEAFKKLEDEQSKVKDTYSKEYERVVKAAQELKDIMDADTNHPLNISSPAQMNVLFYDVLKIPPEKDNDGNPIRSVKKSVIKSLAQKKDENGNPLYPAAVYYQQFAKDNALMTKFFAALPDFMYPGGFVFPSFNQVHAATGRMSCKDPNAQQFPKSITKIVVPRDGFIEVDADYSQIEARVITAIAKNEGLAKLFADPDSDYHTLMASMMYDVDYASVTPKMRSDAKSFNFGIPYGMGFASLAILLHGNSSPESQEDARQKYEMYFKNQPNTRKMFNDIKEMASVHRYTKTQFNRYRYYSFEKSDGTFDKRLRSKALRQAGNSVIQGCIHGNTRIQTKEYGIVHVKDVVGERLHVWNGKKWTLGDITYSGKKRKCIVEFNTGQKFVCSPTHKFLVRSHRGSERFVECQNLHTKEMHSNPHRVVINEDYEKSDWKYNSDYARKYYKSYGNNARNVFIDDVGSSFDAGVVLGRLASDGSIFNREVGGSNIRLLVAEHEKNITPYLMGVMKDLQASLTENKPREGKNQSVDWISVYSRSLTREVHDLDVKNQISDRIFKDTEMLRGFLRGLFDGDGGFCGKAITLTFGNQDDFEPFCRQIQKALLFFGVRSKYHYYYYCHKITISVYDNEKFLDVIGFINKEKQNPNKEIMPIKSNRIFGKVIIPNSVTITDEYIDMYDVCNTEEGYYVADGIVTHNTAADIFKISVGRNFTYIRKNKLLGLFLIIDMIHDEQLMEINIEKLNIMRVLADIGKNMQFKLDGYPPLYIGAGVGNAWGVAKSKMNEIHPNLLEEFTKEAEKLPIFRESTEPINSIEVEDYFNKRIYEFRRDKILDYINDADNWHKEIHPAIGGLINLQFNYGRGDDPKAYKWKDGKQHTEAEFLKLNLADFIEEFKDRLVPTNGEVVSAEKFKIQTVADNTEEDVEYDDGEDGDAFDDLGMSPEEELEEMRKFKVLEENEDSYGVKIQDLISAFGICLLRNKKVCGLDVRGISKRDNDKLAGYLAGKVCGADDDNGLQVIFLKEGNIINKTGVYVRNVAPMELRRYIKGAS